MGYETRLYVGERFELNNYVGFVQRAQFQLGSLGTEVFSNRNHKVFTTPIDFNLIETTPIEEIEYEGRNFLKNYDESEYQKYIDYYFSKILEYPNKNISFLSQKIEYDPTTDITTGKYREAVREDNYGDRLHYGSVEDVVKALMEIYVKENYVPVLPVIAYLNSIKDIYSNLVVVMFVY